MEDVIAVAVFITAVVALMLLAMAVTAPFIQYRIIEAPVAPPADVPARHIYVYSSNGKLYAVDYEGLNPAAFQRVAGIPGTLVAVFTVWPGGYNCTLYGNTPVKIGQDPYTGLWCPPPYTQGNPANCAPTGITSRGRWLLVQYSCP